MDRSSLLQYVGAVKDLEAELFANEKIAEGAHAKAPKKPTPPVCRHINEPEKPSGRGGGSELIIGAIACIVGLFLGGLIKYIALFFGLLYFFGGLSNMSAESNESEAYYQAQEVYKLNCEAANAEYSREQARYEQRLQQYACDCNDFQSNTLCPIANANAQLKQSLDTLYSADIIFPKYRNLVAVSAIYEYLSSGRCDRLDGSNGAYNLYEMELRQNIVIGQLSAILSNLEQIRTSQYTLYQEITSANNKSSHILSNIENQSELTAYYSEVSAKSTDAIKCLSLIKGH